MAKKGKVEKMDKQHSHENDQFVKQLQEEARREAINKLIEKYWKHAVALVLAIVLVSAVSISVSVYRNNVRMNYASDLYRAINVAEAGNYSDSIEMLEGIFNNEKAPAEIRTITGMHLANFYVQMDNLEDAIVVYSKVRNTTRDAFIKEVSGLMKVNLMIRMNDDKYNEGIEKLLKVLTKEGKVLRFLALEQKMIFELNNEKKEEAKETYNQLKLMESTENSRNRISEIYDSYINDNDM